MGSSLCCLAASPATLPAANVSLYAALEAPSERPVASEAELVGPPGHDAMQQGAMPDLDHPVVLAGLWQLLDRSSKAALRRTCKRLRLAVDSNLQHVATASLADMASEGGVLSNTSSGRSSRSSTSLSAAHFPPSWSHISSLTLRSMQDVSRLFSAPPRSPHLLHLSSLQTLTVQLDKCTHNQLRRLVRLPVAVMVTHLQLDNCQCLSAVSLLLACSSLRHLSITERAWDNRWRDATIDQCTHLHSLHMRSRFVSSLPVSTLWRRLQDINVSNCKLITSLAPLTGCTSLRSLDICSTGVWDLSPLSTCTQLSKLALSRCGRVSCASLTALSTCTALTSLSVAWTNISDLSPLAALTLLQQLDISSTAVADLSPLAGCSRLQELDTSFCERLTGLTALGITSSVSTHSSITLQLFGQAQRTVLQGRQGPTASTPAPSQLRWLDISACYGIPVGQGPRAGGVGSGRRAPRAGDVDSTGDGAEPILRWDLSPLAHCTALQTLAMSRNGFTDLSPLACCTALVNLDLSRCCDIACIAALASCTALTALDISWTCVSNLSALTNHVHLTRLDASHCAGLLDLAPLGTCTRLQQLLLRGCSLLEDLRPLANCKRLALLNVTRCNRIVDLAPLAACGLRERGRLLVGDDQHIMYWELRNEYPHH